MDVATQGTDTPATELYMHDEHEPTLSERFMAGDLAQHLLSILRNQTVVWGQKTTDEQREEELRMQNRVRSCVRQAVRIIAAQGCVSIGASVETVNIKADGIKATLTVPKSSADRHHLFDAAGEEVLIVLPQYELALGGDEIIPNAAQQPEQPQEETPAGPDLAEQAAA
jgi:hypothetical protein